LVKAHARVDGGRRRAADAIDPRVGFDQLAGLGAHVGAAAPLGRVHAADAAAADKAAAALRAGYALGEDAPDVPGVVLRRIGPEG